MLNNSLKKEILSLKKNIAKYIMFYRHSYEAKKYLSTTINIQNKSIVNLKHLCVDRQILILVPHADDELLGNYNLLIDKGVNKTLLYFQYTGCNPSMKQTRRLEFLNLANKYNLSVIVSEQDSGFEALKRLLANNTYEYILVPSYMDWHDEHRAVAMSLFSVLKGSQINSHILLYHISVPHPISCITHYFPMKRSDSLHKYKMFRELYPSQNVNTIRFHLQEVLSARLFSIDCYSMETYIGMTAEEYIPFINRLLENYSEAFFNDWKLYYNNIYIINKKLDEFYLANKNLLCLV